MTRKKTPATEAEEHLTPQSAEAEASVPPATEAAAAESAAAEPQAGSADATPAEDYRDLYLRLRADFENFRKRTRREKEEWTQRCLENLCGDLLTVLDHFDLGIDNCRGGEFTADTLKGFEMVRGQLTSTLSKYGLSSVEVSEAGVFDPNLHEAITHLPSPAVPEGHVVAVTRKGYQLGSRLLRPVQVVVSAGGENPSGEES